MAIATGLAIAAAGAATAGASVIGAKKQSKAARRAAAASQANNDANNALAREQFGQIMTRTEPFYQTGVNATNQLNALLAGDQTAFNKFRASTNYQDQLNEGFRGLNTAYAGRGLLDSGAARKAAIQFGQSQAANSLGGYMNLLGNQQNAGLSANATLAGANTNLVNAVTQNNNVNATNQGNALLARGQAGANMWGGIANGLGTALGGLGSSYGGGLSSVPQSAWNGGFFRGGMF